MDPFAKVIAMSLDERANVYGYIDYIVGQGNLRTYRVKLDEAQYEQDLQAQHSGSDDVYSCLNLLLRRRPKENNFKAVLDSVRMYNCLNHIPLSSNNDCLCSDLFSSSK